MFSIVTELTGHIYGSIVSGSARRGWVKRRE